MSKTAIEKLGIYMSGRPGYIFVFYDDETKCDIPKAVAKMQTVVPPWFGNSICFDVDAVKNWSQLSEPTVAILHRQTYFNRCDYEWHMRIASFDITDFLDAKESESDTRN